MLKLRRILVPISHLWLRSHAAAMKAGQLAKASGATVELFHALDYKVDVYAVPDALEPQSFELAEQKRILGRLESIAARLRRLGVRVTTAVVADYPAHEAIIRRAADAKSDLIVVDAHSRHRVPTLLRVTDWELLRHSPVPVLLVKNARRYQRPAIVAAVDPQHSFSKPSGLDDNILQSSVALERLLRGKLHVLHAYLAIPLTALSYGTFSPEAANGIREQAERRAKAGLAKLLSHSHVPKARQHLVPVNPLEAIPQTVRDTRGEILVMGAISRRGLKRIFVGNTAERLLDDIECDVLIVKPKHFDARTPSRPRGIHWPV